VENENVRKERNEARKMYVGSVITQVTQRFGKVRSTEW